MPDELKISVGPEKFSEKNTDEKLDLIYQAVVTQQHMCTTTVEGFKEACGKYDFFISKHKTITRLNKIDKINKGKCLGFGVGGGFSLSAIIEFIRDYISGG